MGDMEWNNKEVQGHDRKGNRNNNEVLGHNGKWTSKDTTRGKGQTYYKDKNKAIFKID